MWIRDSWYLNILSMLFKLIQSLLTVNIWAWASVFERLWTHHMLLSLQSSFCSTMLATFHGSSAQGCATHLCFFFLQLVRTAKRGDDWKPDLGWTIARFGAEVPGIFIKQKFIDGALTAIKHQNKSPNQGTVRRPSNALDTNQGNVARRSVAEGSKKTCHRWLLKTHEYAWISQMYGRKNPNVNSLIPWQPSLMHYFNHVSIMTCLLQMMQYRT